MSLKMISNKLVVSIWYTISSSYVVVTSSRHHVIVLVPVTFSFKSSWNAMGGVSRRFPLSFETSGEKDHLRACLRSLPKSALLLVEMAWSGDVDVPPGHAGKVDVQGSTWAHPAGKGDIGASAAAGGYLHLQHYHHSHPWCQSANQGTTEWAIAGDDTMACVWLQPNWSWDGQANFTNLFRISSI